MELPSIDIKSTPIFFEFSKRFAAKQKLFAHTVIVIDAQLRVGSRNTDHWLSYDEFIIDSFFNRELLEDLSSRIHPNNRNAMKKTLKTVTCSTYSHMTSITKAYERIRNKYVKRVESRRFNRYLYTVTICRRTIIKKDR